MPESAFISRPDYELGAMSVAESGDDAPWLADRRLRVIPGGQNEETSAVQTIAEGAARLRLVGGDDREVCIATFRRGRCTHHPLASVAGRLAAGDDEAVYIATGYFAPGSIQNGTGRSADNLVSIPLIPFDVDLKDRLALPPDKMRALPDEVLDRELAQLREELQRVFARAGVPLHQINSSGYGLHAFIRVAEEDQRRTTEIREVHKELIQRINRLAGRPLVDPRASDAGTRIVRLPGSLNRKANPPRPVTVVAINDELEPTRLDDLSIGLGVELHWRPPTCRPPKVVRILTDAEIEHLVQTVRGAYTEGKRNHISVGVSGMLFKAGVSRDQAVEIFDALTDDDPEWRERLKNVHATYDKGEAGLQITGYRWLEEAELSSDVLNTLSQMLPDAEWEAPNPESDSETAEKGTGAGRNGSQATLLVDLVLGCGAELFHSPDGGAYVTLPVGDHRETLEVDRLNDHLGRLYYEQYRRVPGEQALKEACGVLRGRARYEGAEYAIWTRLAEHGGRLYLDLGDASWQAVEIRADGWRLVASDELPVRFRRPPSMKPLPVPQRGGSLHELDPFINAENADDHIVIKGWLAGLFCLGGERAILQLLGEQGTSKSTLARMLRSLVDPSASALRPLPRNEEPLILAARNGLIVAFDNASYISNDMSDALCRLTTGGGIGKRKMYTDADEVVLEVKRPVILTGINNVASRSDLQDRAVTVTLRPISNEARRTAADLDAEFERARPRIIGGLLDAVSAALANRDRVRLASLPRLADFALWGEAAAPALGWAPKQFALALERNRELMDEAALAESPLGSAVLTFMAERAMWRGTATELLKQLNEVRDREIAWGLREDRKWPTQPNTLSKQLTRVAPILRRLGVEVMPSEREGKRGTRLIILCRKPETHHDSRPHRQPIVSPSSA